MAVGGTAVWRCFDFSPFGDGGKMQNGHGSSRREAGGVTSVSHVTGSHRLSSDSKSIINTTLMSLNIMPSPH